MMRRTWHVLVATMLGLVLATLAGPTVPQAVAETTFRVETVATGLNVPWEMAFAPDGRAFVTERPGRLRVFQDGRLLPEPVATLSEVAAVGEGGLLGLALHPNFADNHWLYLYYTTRTSGGQLINRVVRYTEDGNRLTAPAIMVDGIPGASTHDGGRLAFGPDGKLYITTGDTQRPEAAQDRSSLAGKILRINPDGSIPADNPFPGSPVYSYGHRNPQGLAWHPQSGQLYATEHGPSGHDEVNRITPGANYGWPDMRGNAGPSDGFTPPIIESGSSTWAPTGATFVRSELYPEWRGNLLFTGLRSRSLWRLTLTADGGAAGLTPVIQGEFGRLRDVVQGPDGHFYVLTSNRDALGSPVASDDRILRVVSQTIRYFPETDHTVGHGFLNYWERFGGLPVFGYPLTEEIQEDGRTVQYFERARFEHHPGAWPERSDVLLGQLGLQEAEARGLLDSPPFQPAPQIERPDCTYYPETGHNLCGGFRAYWERFGGLAIYGYPISEEFVDPETGFVTQYFERQRFEWQPGAWPERYDVLLGRLGAEVLSRR